MVEETKDDIKNLKTEIEDHNSAILRHLLKREWFRSGSSGDFIERLEDAKQKLAIAMEAYKSDWTKKCYEMHLALSKKLEQAMAEEESAGHRVFKAE